MTSSNTSTEVEGLIPYNETKTQLQRPTKMPLPVWDGGRRSLLYLNSGVQILEEEIWLG